MTLMDIPTLKGQVDLIMVRAQRKVLGRRSPVQRRETQMMIGSFQWITYDIHDFQCLSVFNSLFYL